MGLGPKRRLTIDYDGNLRLYSLNATADFWLVTWEALIQRCKVHGICGRNAICVYTPEPKCSCPPGYEMLNKGNWNEGCKPKFNLTCSEPVKFVEIRNMDFYGFDLNYSESTPFDHCKKLCSDDCRCQAFLYKLGGLKALCYTKGWWLLFRRHGDVAPGLQDEFRRISSHFRMYLSTLSSRRQLKTSRKSWEEGLLGLYTRVFWKTKRVVAVKKLADIYHAEDVFWAEVTTIGKIHHMNLVRTWGFCSENKHRLLIYEYIENGSLDKHLFPPNFLGWEERLKVAIGIAKGLAYLHHECLEWVIHCDVKPENILLDSTFEPKIADFGLAKLSQRDGRGSQLSQMRGTKGYMAPEWASNLPITAKVDVYSYGVMILEIVKGIRLSNWVLEDDEEIETELTRFVRVAKRRIQCGEDSWMEELLDPRLEVVQMLLES
ncbi:hypothetical protein M0R45_024216 [Rubus argutus]|uniref:non-specific serine/threonine protein kinase n=1 Tax=Rubus argutus TaxID=59490 RepID=A0AAW1WTL5_RUBAR